MNAIIIGSGVSGLTAAAALAKAGHDVTVLEQFHRPGGVTAPYEKAGFRWDLGQLMIEGLGPDEPTGQVLAELGVLEAVPVRVEDRGYVFPDFELRKPAEYAGPLWRMQALKRLFPEDAPGLDRYWQDNLRFTRLVTFARRMETATGVARLYWQGCLLLTLLPFLKKKDWSAAQLMSSYFSREELRAVFISILADFFTPPSQFIGLGVFALNAEVTFDQRIPKALGPHAEQLYQYSVLGGAGALVQALVDGLTAHGGKLEVGCPVTKILVEGGRVTGVETGAGQRLPADVVVASGGVRETFLDLVGGEHLPEGFAEQVRNVTLMDSIFMVHLGVDFDPRPHVHGPVTYYYGTYDVEGEVARAREGIYHEGQAGFVVHVPSLHTPGMAPDGLHAMTVYTICPDRLRDGQWSDLKEGYAAQLLAYAEQRIPGLREHIVLQEILTPDDFRQRTHLQHHAFGGLAPVLGAWRAPHRTPVEGLWFVGAQSESGGGVGAVVPAAYKVAKSILREAQS